MIEKFKNTSPAGQIAIVLSALGILSLVLGLLWFFAFRTEYRPVFTHLDPPDAAAIIAELDKRKIPYRLADGGASIAVPDEQADAIRVSMAESAAGRRGTTGFELFDKSDMGITDFAQKINFQRALQGELERTIEALDGVKSARVHLSLGDDRLFREDRALPKASALIEMRDGHALSDQTVDGVRRLVAASVPSLDASAVVVLDAKGHVFADAADIDTHGSNLSPAAVKHKAVETIIAADVRQVLEPVFGVGYFDVAVLIGASGGTSLPDPNVPPFSMTQRDYPLRVTLTLKVPVADKVLDSARALVAKTIAMRPELGDSIIIDRPRSAVVSLAEPSTRAAPEESRPVDISSKKGMVGQSLATILVAAGLGALLLIVGLLVVMRLRRKSLAPRERQQFAAHLQALVDGEGDR